MVRRRAGTQTDAVSRGSRALDLIVAGALIALLSPLLLVRAAVALAQRRRLFERRACLGRGRAVFERLRFAGPAPLAGLAVWFNVLRGDLALVGPRALLPDDAAVDDADARFAARPGLISPYAVRRRVGLAHASERTIDEEYAQARSLWGDLGILLRAFLGVAFAGVDAPRPQPARLNFFGVPLANTTMDAALAWIIDASAPGRPRRQLAFVNADCLNLAWGDLGYRGVLRRADLVLPDGIGIRVGCRLLGWGLRENVNGTDMFPLLCQAAAASGRSLFLLGARPGIAAAAAAAMQQRVPGLRIAGIRDGYFPEGHEQEVIARINASGADILLVAFGAPRQETWIARHRAALAAPVAMGVGGLFDFYSGRMRRAPLWMRELGLEWVYRLLQEPGRLWRRYLVGNPVFLYRVWLQRRHPERFALPAA